MLIALETIANAIGRPFGLDFYFEQTFRLTDWQGYDWGHEAWTHTGLVSHTACRTGTLYIGPFQLSMSRPLSAA